jgi:large subunit ribosomal protein L23
MSQPYSIIQRVRLTEKGSALQEKSNRYVFSVNPAANKIQIREAVEKLFKVKVLRVNTMNCDGKVRRQYTKQRGTTSHWKKAVVTLKQGDKIDLGV